MYFIKIAILNSGIIYLKNFYNICRSKRDNPLFKGFFFGGGERGERTVGLRDRGKEAGFFRPGGENQNGEKEGERNESFFWRKGAGKRGGQLEGQSFFLVAEENTGGDSGERREGDFFLGGSREKGRVYFVNFNFFTKLYIYKIDITHTFFSPFPNPFLDSRPQKKRGSPPFSPLRPVQSLFPGSVPVHSPSSKKGGVPKTPPFS